MLPVIAIVGNSNSGKTTVASFLIEALSRCGYRVAAIKHCPHGHDIDRADSDTGRLYTAGATTVIASSPGQMTRVDKTSGDGSLSSLVGSVVFDADLVIAEGFKDSEVAKILVAGPDGTAPAVVNVIATVDGPIQGHDVPDYRRDEVDILAGQIERQHLDVAGKDETTSLTIDGEDVPLSRFAGSALRGTVRGYLSSLKDIPADPADIRLSIRRDRPKRSDRERKSA
ncbi:MAG: molybdopterin-guanine dinucleotide biosynthesis protein B [Chloroflexi bacterium]|nr:molybdopterin-guanine dinucleotide biosynthesis protein B [Chloroflexota bacterium]